jgi:hypothetical protein
MPNTRHPNGKGAFAKTRSPGWPSLSDALWTVVQLAYKAAHKNEYPQGDFVRNCVRNA